MPDVQGSTLEVTVQGHYRHADSSGEAHGYLFLNPSQDARYPISTNYLRGVTTPNNQLLITFSEPPLSGSLGTSEAERLISVQNLETGAVQTYEVNAHEAVSPFEFPAIARTLANDSFAVISTLYWEQPGIGSGFNRITILSLADGSIKTVDIPVPQGEYTSQLSFKSGHFIDATHAQIDFQNGQSYSVDTAAGTATLIQPASTSALTSSTSPNDYFYSTGDLGWLDQVGAVQAWNTTRGAGATVAVVDTGIDFNHPDIMGNIWVNSAEANGLPGVDDDGNGFVDDIHGWDFVNQDNLPMDDNGHGTFISGIIGAVADNMRGIVGIAPESKIIPVKALDASGSGLVSNVISGIRYAADLGASVINLSLSVLRSFLPKSLQTAFQNAERKIDDIGSEIGRIANP